MSLFPRLLLVTASMLFSNLNPFMLPPEQARTVDSLFSLESVESRAAVFDQAPVIYFGAVFRTVRVSFDTLLNRFREPKKVTGTMGLIRKFERIPLEPPAAPFGTYDFEARILLARGWCLINIDTMRLDTAGRLVVVMRGNDHPALCAKYEPGHRGFFSVKNDQYYMRWRIERRGGGSARVGVVTWMAPRAYVPHWLYRFIATRALPGALEDFEKGMLRKTP